MHTRGGHQRGIVIGPHRLAADIVLAPLSGISDVPFRRLARRFGASLVFSEMVASGELVKGSCESLRRAMADGDGLHAVQLAGREPQMMGEAAHRVAELGADIIDINFGCPAKKVVGGLSGSALMREPELALRIVEATVSGAGRVPVTLKMRLGWDRGSMNAADIAVRAEATGVQMITVHGRTRDQFYEGSADWAAIAAVKAAVAVPVLANGDLVDASQEQTMRDESSADGLMIGRGACGRPWFPGLLAGAVDHAVLSRMPLSDLVCEHLDLMLRHYGTHSGLRQARKHLGWYLDRAASASESGTATQGILQLDEPDAVFRQLKTALAGLTILDAEDRKRPVRQEAA